MVFTQGNLGLSLSHTGLMQSDPSQTRFTVFSDCIFAFVFSQALERRCLEIAFYDESFMGNAGLLAPVAS